jgi:hypothetical protein
MSAKGDTIMTKFLGKNNEIYYPKDIRCANPRIIYWIIFPQGVIQKTKDWESSGNLMVAKTLKKAKRLAKRYGASEIQRMIQCDLGRWQIASIVNNCDNKLTDDELWNKYKDNPEVVL